MFYFCCFQTTQVTGHKKNNRKGCGCSCSHRVYSYLQQLWPCTRKKANRKSQGENASVSEDQRERCRELSISADTLQKLVEHLVPSLQGGDPFFVPAFLSTYRRFATPLQVLNLLCKRYEYFSSNNEEDEQVKNTFCSFLKTWMDKNPEDFWDHSDLLPLKYLKTFLSRRPSHCSKEDIYMTNKAHELMFYSIICL
ncbi:ral guanine nucleotide dissociation stimulator-like isoform X1 [Rattus norvegicus]|uniref:ral guanine nucleotide dissociation stimulator-like isoform X1 n=1 Tax=Rattus norvegicus TaxID=10116 RepID=UPI0004E48840|nr:ral guanine nucleotide dissociation stimulator-like [Rattus norvegicus]|eukprot:XP_017455816.1 PREDICTED: ral guanine nucleotide dissociation stimulator-like [Rattus norvegicus]